MATAYIRMMLRESAKVHTNRNEAHTCVTLIRQLTLTNRLVTSVGHIGTLLGRGSIHPQTRWSHLWNIFFFATPAHFIYTLPRCRQGIAWSKCTQPLPPQCARTTLENCSYTVPSASDTAEIVDGRGLCARRLHVNTVVAQRMTDLHSSLELFK